MIENNVLEFMGREAISDPLTALLRSGAQHLINQAAEAEFRLSLKRRRIGFSRAYLKSRTRHWWSAVRLLVSAGLRVGVGTVSRFFVGHGISVKNYRARGRAG